MASIAFSELVDVLTSHPDYLTRWHQGVSATDVLHIEFAAGSIEDTEAFPVAGGSTLAIDRDRAGLVRGIEIL